MGKSLNSCNVILSDSTYENMAEFKKSVERASDEKWEIKIVNSNAIRKNALDNIVRYIKYFIFPLLIFFNRKKFDKIIAWQQFYGILFAFYCNLFQVKKTTKLTIMTFIYKEKKKCKKMYYKFIKFAIANKYVDYLIVFSEQECKYYSELFDMDISKFKFLKLGINRINIKDEYVDKEKYIISAGRSNRNYEFLQNSIKDTNYNLKIVTDLPIKSISENITIYNNTSGIEYYKLLKNAWCVVIPLENINISSGQLVVLQAMQLKTPIIITNSKGVMDYIDDGIDGFIIENKTQKLIDALNKLENIEIYNRIVSEAYKKYENNYSIVALGKKIGILQKGI